ncbi:MAG: hypothetical protein HZA14_06690 [Nitrospirae bacterium]|nr:hypothetical protein [Nitrospirota bacterium]
MKKLTLISMTALAVIALAFSAYALAPSQTGNGVNTGLYHAYDGLICSDCHTMHNSEGGAPMAITGGPNHELLKKATTTDVCLSCHKEGSNTSATDSIGAFDSGWSAPIVMTLDGDYAKNKGIAMPGGDFYYSNISPGKGHNPYKSGNESSVEMIADPILGVTPPGGSLSDGGNWDCHSCHGMHSRFSDTYSAFRQIQRKVNGIVHTGCDQTVGVIESSPCNTAKVGTTAAGFEAILSNTRGNIQADGLTYENTDLDGGLEGADLWAPESDSNHNVYKGGLSSFCSTCHGGFHGGAETGGDAIATSSTGNTADGTSKAWMRHPTNVGFSGDANEKYKATSYTKVVVNTQGTNPNPGGYDYKYPLAKVAGTWTTSTTGTVATGDKVMCLSCHVAHASRYDNATRWNVNSKVAFIANGETDGYGDVSNGDNPVYGCNKCHQKNGSKAYIKNF